MTNDERNPKPECRKSLRGAFAGFVIRILSFLRISSFVLRICEEWFMESPFRCRACIGTMNQIGGTPLPALSGVQQKREHAPAVQETLRTLDCGGMTPLSLRVSLVPDALAFAHAFCLAPDGA